MVTPQPRGLLGDRFLQRLRGHYRLDQIAPVRQIRADRRLAHPAKVEAQEAIGLAHRRGFVGLLVDQPPQRDRLAETHARLSAVQHDDQELAQRPDARPRVGEQRLDERVLRIGRTAPEHRHRHELRIERRLAHQRRGHLRGVADGSAVRVLSGFRLRMTENTARSPTGNSCPIGASAEGSSSRCASSSSTRRLDRCRSWRT